MLTVAACYNCGKAGHIQKDCPEADNKSCYRCGGSGHMARECTARGEDTRKCYNCGNSGHISKECPQAGESPDRGDRGTCYRYVLV